MVNSDKLTKAETAIYQSMIASFFTLGVDAETAMETFENPNIGANLKAAAAFVEAACTLVEYENCARRLHNGNNQSTGDTAATPQN